MNRRNRQGMGAPTEPVEELRLVSALVRLALVLIGTLDAPPEGPPAPGDLPAMGIVAVETVETFARPSLDARPLERLFKGQAVRVLDLDEAPGWVTIAPTESAFAWIDQATVRPEGPGLARVSVSQSAIHLGVPGATEPGPERQSLEKGATVRLIDRPVLRTGTGRDRKTWLALAVPEGDVRYLRVEAIVRAHPDDPEATAERRASYAPPEPSEAAGAIAAIEAEHQAILGGPVEHWRLEPVKSRYEALRARLTDPVALSGIDKRLRLVAQHEAMARSARAFATVLERSRRRDQEVAITQRNLGGLNQPGRRAFDAEGLVQPSSRQVEGRRVFALIGDEGSPIAYLDIPAGLDARPVVSKRVGVRGTVRYDQQLRSKLIAVRDIESLE